MPETTTKLETELSGLKIEADEIIRRRRELMVRLSNAGFTYKRIGEIYGCSKQYVSAEIQQYQAQFERN